MAHIPAIQRSISGPHCSAHSVDRMPRLGQSRPMTKRRPPATWAALHSLDMLNTTLPKHRIDLYISDLEVLGYEIETEETAKGYRLLCTKSPHDRPKRPKLRVVK